MSDRNLRRYASHYLLWPGIGFLKQFAVETGNGQVVRIFPCVHERESVEWHPGVLLLIPAEQELTIEDPTLFQYPVIALDQLPEGWESYFSTHTWQANLLYPFDFTLLKPVGETQHILLP